MKPGVEMRARSLRIVFRYQRQQCRERLSVDGVALPPTPPNLKYAQRIAVEIGEKIPSGVFRYADYFPDSPKAQVVNSSDPVPLLFDVIDTWLRVAEPKASTRRQYRIRINSFWKLRLKNVPIHQVAPRNSCGPRLWYVEECEEP
jgi:integrase